MMEQVNRFLQVLPYLIILNILYAGYNLTGSNPGNPGDNSLIEEFKKFPPTLQKGMIAYGKRIREAYQKTTT